MLRRAPRALWLVIFAFTFDGAAYYGILPLMKSFIGQDVGIRPEIASIWVSVFTCALTLIMLFVGKPTEGRLGIRKSLMLALFLTFMGRLLYSSAPFLGGVASLAVSLVVIAVGEGILQPLAYAGVKQYTTEKTSSMGFALLYAGLNFGVMLMGPVSAKVRTTFDVPFHAGKSALSGFDAVNWVATGVSLVTFAAFVLLMTRAAEAMVVRRIAAATAGSSIPTSVETSTSAPAGRTSPFRDPRFILFIFALLPVRTLFAHQWLTMPEYVLRCYPRAIADRMEWFVGSVNPLVVFFAVPLFAALTRRFHVLTLVIVGSFVSSAATFVLCFGVHTSTLVGYFVVFSIGEALWTSRFLEYASELAPEGRVAQYMGVASLPWFVAKMTTGFYSGFVLERFVPKGGPTNAGTMWLIYGSFAMSSPIVLMLARRWLRSSMPGPASAPSKLEHVSST